MTAIGSVPATFAGSMENMQLYMSWL